MKHTYLAVFAILISSNIHAADLIPFSKYVDERPNWINEGSEVAYAESRCGALFVSISAYYKANGSSEEDKYNARFFGKEGYKLMTRGASLSSKYGMSVKNINNRNELLMVSYTKKLIENKQINNNIFSEDIEYDQSFCNDLVKVTKVIDKATSNIKNTPK